MRQLLVLVFALLAGTAGAEQIDSVGWTLCADYGGVCHVAEISHVRYGTGETWLVVPAAAGSNVDCNNVRFLGDPADGQWKYCYSKPDAPAAASSPTGGTTVSADVLAQAILGAITPAQAAQAWTWGATMVIGMYLVAWCCGQVLKMIGFHND
jgi:hypothetical protein